MVEHGQTPSPAHSKFVSGFHLVASLLLLLFVFIVPLTAHGQALYGVLTGNVTDTSGAAVANANVEALNVQTGLKRVAKSDNSGIYRLSDLQPGTYKITITAPGFGTSESNDVPVSFNQVRRVDAQLKVAGQHENVTVTAEAAILQTDKADVHTDLSSQLVDNLPTSGAQGRNFQSLLQVIPGAGLTATTNSLAANPERAMNTNVNGQSNQGVNTRIDGAQDAYPWLPANTAYVPPSDAIQEVNVVTNSFDAEQGMAGGAAVNVQIKSGTNEFHGSADWFHTDQNFAALNYFQKPNTPKNRNNQNQLGGTFGGPIVKNKVFFFVDYERTTQRQKAGPVTRSLPTAAMAAGDFSSFLPAVGSTSTFSGEPFVNCNTTPAAGCIYDPATGDANGNGKQEFTCNGVANVICPNRIDPASQAMLQLLQPSIAQEFATGNNLNNFTGSGTGLFNRDNADVKVNFVPSEKSTLFARYSFSRILVFDPPLLGDAGGDATNGGQLGNAPGLIQSVGLGTTYTFTPHLLFDWNFGFTRQRLGATFDLDSPKGLDLLKIPGTNGAGVPGGDSELYNGLPAFQVNSASANVNFGNPNTGNPYLFRDNQFVSGANLSWTRGKHNFRGGFEFNHTQLNHFQPQGGSFQTARGSFLFNGTVTLPSTVNVLNTKTGVVGPGSPTPAWYNSVADFLLGLPSETGKAYQIFNPIGLRWSQYAWYVRDQWQVLPKLTLNVGVRWEFYPFGYADNGLGMRWFNPADGNVYIGGLGNVPRDSTVDVGNGQFLPRVGASYRLTPSTVIRAGYGMSADPNNWRFFRNAFPSAVISDNKPLSQTTYIPVASLTGLNGTLGSGAYTVPTGLVNIAVPDISSGVVPLPTNAATTTVPNPFHRGYINSFNFTVEQEFKSFVFQAAYVGARDIRPLVNMNINASAPGTTAAGGLISTALGKTYTGNINGEVPFDGGSSYDALQTKVTRRFSNGSTFGFVWTWSKTLDYEDDEELNSMSFPYPAFWQKNYSYANFDRPSNIEIYGVLQLPFGKGQRWITSGVGSRILSGWQLNPVVSIMSGVPFTVQSTAPLNANGSIQVANLIAPFKLVGGQPLPTGSTCAATDMSCHYFDPTAFANPASNTYGNTIRNQFRGPGYFNMNLSLAREFSVTERVKLQLRADAMGFTNTPHFNNPNATVGGANFGVITSTLQPPGEGFFGNDPGSRVVWLGARVTF